MQQISNRTLALLMVAAIIVSLTGTLISLNRIGRVTQLTGFAIDEASNASVSLTIETKTEVNWTTYQVLWGTGAVDVPAYYSCNLSTQGYNGSRDDGLYSLSGNGCDEDSFNAVTGGLILENTGNVNVTLNITAGKNASNFIGGTSDGGPLYWYNITDETGLGAELYSCSHIIRENHTSPADVYENMAGNYSLMWAWPDGTGEGICDNTGGGFSYEDYADTLRFDIFIRVPSDAAAGAHSDTITAIIEEISTS